MSAANGFTLDGDAWMHCGTTAGYVGDRWASCHMCGALMSLEPTQTERNAARWLALVTLPKEQRPEWRLVPCASCENVNPAEWGNPFLDVRIAAVVPWDVMGDPRAFAFVCNECASGSEVVL